MQLRDHPSLYDWPPKWAASLDSDPPSSEKSEELILKKAEIRHPGGMRGTPGRHIWISAEYGGKTFFTTIITSPIDPDSLDLLYLKLSNSIGHSIREIGDSEWEE
jgi:hypothetical protein